MSFLLIHKILDATGQRSGDRLLDHGGLDGYVRNEFVSLCARLRLDGGDSFTGLVVREGRDEVGSVEKRGVRHPQFRRFRPKVVRATHLHLRPRQVLRCFTVVWSLNRSNAKTWPVSRHDGGPWQPTHTQR